MMNMKMMWAAVIVAMGLAMPAMAQVKMATFDAQQVISNANAAKRAVSTLQGKREAAQRKIDALEAPLLQKRQHLAEQQGVLAADKFKAAQEGFAKDLAGFRAQALSIQDDLDKENLRLRKEIADAMRDVVSSIAKAKGYDVVLPKSVTFYAGPSVPDISAEVLSGVNSKLK